MDYLAKFYKNQSEVLSEQIKVLEMQLKTIMESEAPASVFSGSGQGQQRFSDADLEAQMRRHKKSSIFKTYTDDEQSQEYKDAKAELERRRGAKSQPVPTPAQTPRRTTTPKPKPRQVQPAAPRPPVEQMGPVGSPSAVPTRTEVQRTQAVADETGLPTALPTNVRPGTMGMEDMDGRPISVQPREKKPMAPKNFNQKASINQQAMEADVDADGEYVIGSDGYAKSPTSWRERYTSNYPTTPRKLGAVQAGPSAAERQDLEDSAMGKGKYKSENVKKAETQTAWERKVAMDTAVEKAIGSKWYEAERGARTPAKPDVSTWAQKVALDSAEEAMRPTKWWETQRDIRTPAKPDVSPKPQFAMAAPEAEEDFSDFWAGKPRYGDLELEDMMRKHKRTNMFGPAIPDEKQSREYRAAKAELKKRGKLK